MKNYIKIPNIILIIMQIDIRVLMDNGFFESDIYN